MRLKFHQSWGCLRVPKLPIPKSDPGPSKAPAGLMKGCVCVCVNVRKSPTPATHETPGRKGAFSPLPFHSRGWSHSAENQKRRLQMPCGWRKLLILISLSNGNGIWVFTLEASGGERKRPLPPPLGHLQAGTHGSPFTRHRNGLSFYTSHPPRRRGEGKCPSSHSHTHPTWDISGHDVYDLGPISWGRGSPIKGSGSACPAHPWSIH